MIRYGDLVFDGSFLVACSLPERIQLVSVGADMPRKLQASLRERLYLSIGTYWIVIMRPSKISRVLCFVLMRHLFAYLLLYGVRSLQRSYRQDRNYPC